MEENKLFENIGWDVVPFSMQHPSNFKSTWDSYFIKLLEYGENYSFIEKVANVPKAIYSVEAKNKLEKLLEVINPNVCHAHNIYHHITPSILSVLKSRDIPTFLTTHDLKIACPAYTMLTHDGVCERCKGGKFFNVIRHKCVKESRALSSVVYLEAILHKYLDSYAKNCSRLISPSKFYIKKFIEWGFKREQLAYIPNFVSLDLRPAGNDVGKYFLYFGRLSPEKGIMTLLKAASIADVPICIIGDGILDSDLKVLADKLGVNAKFFNYMTGESLYEKIRGARSVVLPSEWYENAPLSIMEAYALGVPVIGSEIGGIPELIKNNETGLLFPSGSVEDLADCMRKISSMSDANIRMMGQSGRTWMFSNFTADIYRERMLELYSACEVI